MFGRRDQLLERTARNQIEQLLFVAQIVIDARERDSRTRGDISDRCEAKTFLGEHCRRRTQDMIDVGIVAIFRRQRARDRLASDRLDARASLGRRLEIGLSQRITFRCAVSNSLLAIASAYSWIGNRYIEFSQQSIHFVGEFVAHLFVAAPSETPLDVIVLALRSRLAEHIEPGGIPSREMLDQKLAAAFTFALQIAPNQPIAKRRMTEFFLVYALRDFCERLVAASDPFVAHVGALAIGEKAEQSVFDPIDSLVAHFEN